MITKPKSFFETNKQNFSIVTEFKSSIAKSETSEGIKDETSLSVAEIKNDRYCSQKMCKVLIMLIFGNWSYKSSANRKFGATSSTPNGK